MAKLDTKQILEEFSQITEPTKDDLAKAYFARDIEMKLNFHNQFDHAMDKLGYHPRTYQKQMDSYVRMLVFEEVEECLKNNNYKTINLAELTNSIKNAFNSKLKVKEEKYNMFQQFFNTEDHLGFYSAMEMSELGFLGF